MHNCICCLLKQSFDSITPISFSCSHSEKISSVVKVRRRSLGVHYIILFIILVTLISYLYLLTKSTCTAYTMKCMILLCEFDLSLVGFTVLLFKLLKLSGIVLSLNGWLKLYQNKEAFFVHYISLQKKIKVLKYNKIIFGTIICIILISEIVVTLLLIYPNDFLLLRLGLVLSCSYFQVGTYFESIQQITGICEIYKCFLMSVKNNFLLTLRPHDRFSYYKSIAFIYGMRKEDSSFSAEVQRMNRFSSAFRINVECVNVIFRPLAKYWFLELSLHLVLNVYIIVNADYEKYKMEIVVMALYIINVIIFLSYIVTLCDKFNNMVSVIV